MFLAISITFSENLMFGHGDCSNRTKIKEFRKCVDELYMQETFEVSMKLYNHTQLLSSVGMSDIIFPSENSITITPKETILLREVSIYPLIKHSPFNF